MKYILLVCLISVAAFVSAKPSCVGCSSELTGHQLNTAEEILTDSLSNLSAGDGPYLTLVKVNSGEKKLVAGILYTLNVDLKDEDEKIKTCVVEIWSRPWLKEGANKVTYRCPGEEKFTETHNAKE